MKIATTTEDFAFYLEGDAERVRALHNVGFKYVDLCEWLNEEKLPAVCLGNPDLYLMTKFGENSMAIGLWNNFEDEMIRPMIKLNKPYKTARFIGCEGVLNGDRITLTKPLGAYSYGFVELKR